MSLQALPQLINHPPFLPSLVVNVVPVEPIPGTRPKNCLLNVQKYIEMNGGQKQFGWMFSSLGNFAIRFVGHCVVRTSTGSLICVTPPEQVGVTHIGFLLDNTIDPALQGVERLPARTEALVKNPIAQEYVSLENARHEIALKYPVRTSLEDNRSTTPLCESDAESMTMITRRLVQILPQVKTLVSRIHGANQECFCGSGRKYKKCCRPK